MVDKKDWNILVIDTETGGLDPNKHSLLSVGAVLVKGGEVVAKKEWFIKDDIYNVTPFAMIVNKFDFDNIIKSGKTVGQVSEELWDMIRTHFDRGGVIKAMGHNIAFDLEFIHQNIMSKDMWEQCLSYRNIDTATIAHFLKDCGKIEVDKCGLSNLMEYFGLGDEESNGRHSALFDAEMTFKVYEKMCELM